MEYTPKVWQTGEKITADDLNRIEDGIGALTEEIANLSGGAGVSVLTVETITIGEVGDIPVTGITLDYSNASLTKGESMMLAASVTPSNATNSTVLWESSNTGVATVDNGYVTAVAEGDAVITAYSAENNAITATCTVSVAAAESGGGESGGTITKVQLSTLDVVNGSCVKPDGSVVTISAKAHYVEIPYTDGMLVSTGVNSTWAAGNYPPFIVNENGTYSVPEYTSGNAIEGMTSQGAPYLYTVTLTGYAEGSVVIVNMTYSDITAMESSGAYYYITGGGES